MLKATRLGLMALAIPHLTLPSSVDRMSEAISTAGSRICSASESFTKYENGMARSPSAYVDSSDTQDTASCTMSGHETIRSETSRNLDTDTILPEWESYSFLQMHEFFDCSYHVYNTTKPLYTQNMWKRMRDLFEIQSEVGTTLPKLDETHMDNYYSGYSDEPKGRGTFAKRNFSKGELVHNGAISTVFWVDGLAWKEFVVNLPPPMACDVLEWTWIQEVQDYGPLLCLNLNDAAFMNHDSEFNIAPKNSKTLDFYAVRGTPAVSFVLLSFMIYTQNINRFFFHFRHKRRRRAHI